MRKAGFLRRWAGILKLDVLVLWLAVRDPRVPWITKAVTGAVAAYAVSPIDLLPDFMPLLGYVDDLAIVPAGILFAVSLLPKPLAAELRTEAERRVRPVGRIIAALILATLAATILAGWYVWSH